MHVILGANGHVGSELAKSLLQRGEAVTVILHSDRSSANWEQLGATVAIADAHDAGSLHEAFKRGDRLFLLNPPASPASDTDVEERATVAAILSALRASGLEKIVAESTYGAQPGEHVGDLAVLFELEQGLATQPIPASIIRAAYYMSNWDASLATAEAFGAVHSFYPVDFELPMVAPHDIGLAASRLMTEDVASTGIHYVEGPQRYTPTDVAAAFGSVLRKDVIATEISRERWPQTLREMGFSPLAAESFAGMTAATWERRVALPEAPERGGTTMEHYVAELLLRSTPALYRPLI